MPLQKVVKPEQGCDASEQRRGVVDGTQWEEMKARKQDTKHSSPRNWDNCGTISLKLEKKECRVFRKKLM